MFSPCIDERNLTSDLVDTLHEYNQVLLGVVRVEEGITDFLDLPSELSKDNLGLAAEWNLLGFESPVDGDLIFVRFVDTAILSDEALQFLVEITELE